MFTVQKMAKVALVFLVALMIVSASPQTSVRAEDGKVTEAALAWSSGLIDADGSVIYSITLAAGDNALKDVVVSAVLPEGATFVEATWKPKDAALEGEKGGTVMWKVAEVTAQTFSGPYSFRVKFAGSDAADFEAPGGVKATVAFAGGTADAHIGEETIARFAQSGEIEITPAGTTDLVEVGNTGIWISVPANAVSQNVKLTFARLPITDSTPLPKVAYETWWCSLVGVTASADVAFAQPIIVVFPTRKALLPNSVVPVFTQDAGGEFVLATEPTNGVTPAESVTNAYGNKAFILLSGLQLKTTPFQLAVGINESIRTAGISPVVTGITIKITERTNFGSDPAPWF